MGETIFDNIPRKIATLKNYKYYFTCSNVLKHMGNNINVDADMNFKDNFILDYRYSLIYFYIKCGFNFFKKGKVNLNIKHREDGIFFYSKNIDRSWRNSYVNEIKDSKLAIIKGFSEEDVMWTNFNNNLYHTPFMLDYNEYKFNLVFETQPPFEEKNGTSKFVSEKTLKALMVETPTYVLLQPETYHQLTSNGFYFLNQEFGEYNFDNYKKLCTFMNDCSSDKLNTFFNTAFEKSKHNKERLEAYIYSYKEKEIKLILS
jgi:hypothetical protein